MKGYEIKSMKYKDPTVYVHIIGAESIEEAREKACEGKDDSWTIISVELIYHDIQKQFYDIGDKYGWD